MIRNRQSGAGEGERIAETLVRKSGSSFYWAMRVLPRQKRMAMYAIYAFCRIVDDIADGPGHLQDKMQRLGFWRDELGKIYSGAPNEPVSKALIRPVQEYCLDQQDFLAVIAGMERDAGPTVRMADDKDLETYCDQVACSVGRLANRVFGVDQETGKAIAASLGQALQLTNILRDVSEDAACGRIYLPHDLLIRHGVAGGEPAMVIAQPGFSSACGELSERASDHFKAAERLLSGYGRSVMRPAVLMMQTYWLVLRRLQKRGWRTLDQRVSLSGPEKLMIMLRYGLLP